jgi:uncharacterized protein (DUF427 family)
VTNEAKLIKVPDAAHPITIEADTARVVARVGDTVIADTRDALTLREHGFAPVSYIPLSDVVPGRLRPSSSESYCPYKGDASHYVIVLPDGEVFTDAVWTYRNPYPAVATIAGRVAFYTDRVQIGADRTIASGYSVRGFPWAPVSAPVTWDELPDVEMRDFTIATMPARFAQLGDLHEGIDDAVWDIEPLLGWADRDERDRGLGDAPYPPNYPKQEGEPPRVQPSKKVAAHWDDQGNRIDG